MRCARCGRYHTTKDDWLEQLRLVGLVAVIAGAVLLERFVVREGHVEESPAEIVLRIVLLAGVAVVGYFLVLRRQSWMPDVLVDRQSVGRSPEPGRPGWKRVVPVKSIEEEYRFVQFHPFPCACATPGARKVESHGVEIRPGWLGRLVGGRLLPVFTICDLLEVSCPVCRGRFVYRFDIRQLPHIRSGFRRRFVTSPLELLATHVTLVGRLQKRLGAEGVSGLSF